MAFSTKSTLCYNQKGSVRGSKFKGSKAIEVTKWLKERESMKLFLDTEFTGLHKDTTLISVGVVSEDGRTFYAELTDYNHEQVDDWIESHVLSQLVYEKPDTDQAEPKVLDHLKGTGFSVECQGNKQAVRRHFNRWLSQFETVEMVSDCCHFDFVLILDLIADHVLDLPPYIAPVCQDINQDLMVYFNCNAAEAFAMSRELLCEYIGATLPKEQKHHALYDAYVIREIYTFLHEEPNEY